MSETSLLVKPLVSNCLDNITTGMSQIKTRIDTLKQTNQKSISCIFLCLTHLSKWYQHFQLFKPIKQHLFCLIFLVLTPHTLIIIKSDQLQLLNVGQIQPILTISTTIILIQAILQYPLPGLLKQLPSWPNFSLPSYLSLQIRVLCTLVFLFQLKKLFLIFFVRQVQWQ